LFTTRHEFAGRISGSRDSWYLRRMKRALVVSLLTCDATALVLLLVCDALALVTWFACHATVLPSAVSTATKSLAPLPDGSGGWYAVLAPVAVQGEMMNGGGYHLTLRVVERRPDMPHLIHAGGHGKYLAMHCDDRYVAHITKPATSIKTFCSETLRSHYVSGSLPSYDGKVVAAARAAPGEDLAARLARAAREGLPRSTRRASFFDYPPFRGFEPVPLGGCEDRDDDPVFGAERGYGLTTGDLRCEPQSR
jgi:hypothetical protein